MQHPADHRAGGGVPLFLQELARSVLQGAPGEVLPPRLQELLTALRSPGIDLRIAQLAATLGAEFEGNQLARLAEIPVEGAVARLERSGIVEPVGDVRRGATASATGSCGTRAIHRGMESRAPPHSRIAALLETAGALTG